MQSTFDVIYTPGHRIICETDAFWSRAGGQPDPHSIIPRYRLLSREQPRTPILESLNWRRQIYREALLLVSPEKQLDSDLIR